MSDMRKPVLPVASGNSSARLALRHLQLCRCRSSISIGGLSGDRSVSERICTTRFLSRETLRNGQPSVVAVDIIALMDVLKIQKAIVGGFDWGGRTADIMAVLWPERCKGLVSVSGYLIGSQESGKIPLPPKAELQWWYQYYFATERGRAGYDKYRHDFSKLIWQIASPKRNFDDATFDRTAASFNNPDHVAIVIHNYRWRQGLAEGESKYDDLEKRLAQAPVITVPTIAMEGDSNGAPHPDPSSYAKKFSGKYSHRNIAGGSDTICRKRLRRPSPKPSSMLTVSRSRCPRAEHL
jgi:pimeloyl-ACP methyl ester carboxylesterase